MNNDDMIPMAQAPMASMPMGNNLEELYPDTYRQVYPYVSAEVSEMMRNNMVDGLTYEMLNQMTESIINKSGIAMDFDDMQEESTPVQMGGFRRRRRRDRDSLQELIRILLLREFLGRRRRPHFLFPTPFIF